MYAVGNPINLTDPSGKFPDWCRSMQERQQYEDCVREFYGLSAPLQYNIMPGSDDWGNASADYGSPGCWKGPVAYTAPGILTGWSVTVSAYGSAGYGREDVYDFGTMERRIFHIYTFGLSDGGGASAMIYMGVVMGLNNVDDLVALYGGDSYYLSGGMAASSLVPLAPSPEIGIGVMGSQSAKNPEIRTRSLYFAGNLSIGDVLPLVDFSGGTAYAIPANRLKTYVSNSRVDTTSLTNDLQTLTTLPSDLSIYVSIANKMGLPMQNAITWQALKYANIHDEIYVNSQ